MAEDYKTSEARAFREHYDKLVDSIQEPDLPVLGARFFSRQIISRETMEMVGNVTTSRAVRASKLMLAVMAVLETHPDKFERVLGVFREEPVYASFSCSIKATFRYFCGEVGQSPPSAPPTSVMRKYATYSRKIYLRSKLPGKEKWPCSPCKKIIKLATIERKEQTRVPKLGRLESVNEYMQENSMSPVSMDDILQPRDDLLPKVVVVQGVPGIGKSTFAWKFCRRWAKGKIYQQYDLVVLLRMRDTRVREAKKLSDLFFSEDEEFLKQVAKEIIAREGKNILIVMEGIDELPASCLADDTLLSNLLQGLSLPEVAILVTTRPWAEQMLTEKFGNQISRRVEILGFTKEDIFKYASHAFSGEEGTEHDFLEYFHLHPQLESIMHIPLNAAFVVQIYRQFKHSAQAIPQTLTQLYTALIKGLLLRYMKSAPDFSELKIASLENLPEPIKSQFEQLCLLAFMSFTKLSVQVTFTDSEAALYGYLDSLGLMQSSADLSIDTGTTVTHSFLHFTIQEFLAAYHLSKQPAQVRELFLETHKNDNQFHMLLTFLVGLNSDALQYLREPNDSRITTPQLHWLFESQSPKAVREFLGNRTIIYESIITTTLDLYALSYCLCHSDSRWTLTIELRNLTVIYSTEAVSKGEIESLTCFGTNCAGLKLFFSLPKHLFVNLSSLSITSHLIDVDSTVAEVLSMHLSPSLSRFSFLCSNFSITDILGSLCSLFPSLKALAFLQCPFTPSAMSLLCQYITSPSCSSELCLSLCQNTFTENCLQLLISAFACSKSISGACLEQIEISLADFEMLSVALSLNSSLKFFYLCSCSVSREGTELLASALEENKAIEGLGLTNSNINTDGAVALGSMLEVNTTLKKLNLSQNILIGTNGALRLLNALEQNKTLSKLILPSECEPIEYGSILFEQIRRENRVSFVPT